MTAVGNRETGRETWSQVCERPRAAGADTWERAESRSVTQETEHEINEHMGAGVVTFQEGSEGGGKSLWERLWGLRGWSRWEEVGPEGFLSSPEHCGEVGAVTAVGQEKGMIVL